MGEQVPFVEAWCHKEHPLLFETISYRPFVGLILFITSKTFLYGTNIMMAVEIVAAMALTQKFAALAESLEVNDSRKKA